MDALFGLEDGDEAGDNRRSETPKRKRSASATPSHRSPSRSNSDSDTSHARKKARATNPFAALCNTIAAANVRGRSSHSKSPTSQKVSSEPRETDDLDTEETVPQDEAARKLEEDLGLNSSEEEDVEPAEQSRMDAEDLERMHAEDLEVLRELQKLEAMAKSSVFNNVMGKERLVTFSWYFTTTSVVEKLSDLIPTTTNDGLLMLYALYRCSCILHNGKISFTSIPSLVAIHDTMVSLGLQDSTNESPSSAAADVRKIINNMATFVNMRTPQYGFDGADQTYLLAGVTIVTVSGILPPLLSNVDTQDAKRALLTEALYDYHIISASVTEAQESLHYFLYVHRTNGFDKNEMSGDKGNSKQKKKEYGKKKGKKEKVPSMPDRHDDKKYKEHVKMLTSQFLASEFPLSMQIKANKPVRSSPNRIYMIGSFFPRCILMEKGDAFMSHTSVKALEQDFFKHREPMTERTETNINVEFLTRTSRVLDGVRLAICEQVPAVLGGAQIRLRFPTQFLSKMRLAILDSLSVDVRRLGEQKNSFDAMIFQNILHKSGRADTTVNPFSQSFKHTMLSSQVDPPRKLSTFMNADVLPQMSMIVGALEARVRDLEARWSADIMQNPVTLNVLGWKVDPSREAMKAAPAAENTETQVSIFSLIDTINLVDSSMKTCDDIDSFDAFAHGATTREFIKTLVQAVMKPVRQAQSRVMKELSCLLNMEMLAIESVGVLAALQTRIDVINSLRAASKPVAMEEVNVSVPPKTAAESEPVEFDACAGFANLQIEEDSGAGVQPAPAPPPTVAAPKPKTDQEKQVETQELILSIVSGLATVHRDAVALIFSELMHKGHRVNKETPNNTTTLGVVEEVRKTSHKSIPRYPSFAHAGQRVNAFMSFVLKLAACLLGEQKMNQFQYFFDNLCAMLFSQEGNATRIFSWGDAGTTGKSFTAKLIAMHLFSRGLEMIARCTLAARVRKQSYGTMEVNEEGGVGQIDGDTQTNEADGALKVMLMDAGGDHITCEKNAAGVMGPVKKTIEMGAGGIGSLHNNQVKTANQQESLEARRIRQMAMIVRNNFGFGNGDPTLEESVAVVSTVQLQLYVARLSGLVACCMSAFPVGPANNLLISTLAAVFGEEGAFVQHPFRKYDPRIRGHHVASGNSRHIQASNMMSNITSDVRINPYRVADNVMGVPQLPSVVLATLREACTELSYTNLISFGQCMTEHMSFMTISRSKSDAYAKRPANKDAVPDSDDDDPIPPNSTSAIDDKRVAAGIDLQAYFAVSVWVRAIFRLQVTNAEVLRIDKVLEELEGLIRELSTMTSIAQLTCELRIKYSGIVGSLPIVDGKIRGSPLTADSTFTDTMRSDLVLFISDQDSLSDILERCEACLETYKSYKADLTAAATERMYHKRKYARNYATPKQPMRPAGFCLPPFNPKALVRFINEVAPLPKKVQQPNGLTAAAQLPAAPAAPVAPTTPAANGESISTQSALQPGSFRSSNFRPTMSFSNASAGMAHSYRPVNQQNQRRPYDVPVPMQTTGTEGISLAAPSPAPQMQVCPCQIDRSQRSDGVADGNLILHAAIANASLSGPPIAVIHTAQCPRQKKSARDLLGANGENVFRSFETADAARSMESMWNGRTRVSPDYEYMVCRIGEMTDITVQAKRKRAEYNNTYSNTKTQISPLTTINFFKIGTENLESPMNNLPVTTENAVRMYHVDYISVTIIYNFLVTVSDLIQPVPKEDASTIACSPKLKASLTDILVGAYPDSRNPNRGQAFMHAEGALHSVVDITRHIAIMCTLRALCWGPTVTHNNSALLLYVRQSMMILLATFGGDELHALKGKSTPSRYLFQTNGFSLIATDRQADPAYPLAGTRNTHTLLRIPGVVPIPADGKPNVPALPTLLITPSMAINGGEKKSPSEAYINVSALVDLEKMQAAMQEIGEKHLGLIPELSTAFNSIGLLDTKIDMVTGQYTMDSKHMEDILSSGMLVQAGPVRADDDSEDEEVATKVSDANNELTELILTKTATADTANTERDDDNVLRTAQHRSSVLNRFAFRTTSAQIGVVTSVGNSADKYGLVPVTGAETCALLTFDEIKKLYPPDVIETMRMMHQFPIDTQSDNIPASIRACHSDIRELAAWGRRGSPRYVLLKLTEFLRTSVAEFSLISFEEVIVAGLREDTVAFSTILAILVSSLRILVDKLDLFELFGKCVAEGGTTYKATISLVRSICSVVAFEGAAVRIFVWFYEQNFDMTRLCYLLRHAISGIASQVPLGTTIANGLPRTGFTARVVEMICIAIFMYQYPRGIAVHCISNIKGNVFVTDPVLAAYAEAELYAKKAPSFNIPECLEVISSCETVPAVFRQIVFHARNRHATLQDMYLIVRGLMAAKKQDQREISNGIMTFCYETIRLLCLCPVEMAELCTTTFTAAKLRAVHSYTASGNDGYASIEDMYIEHFDMAHRDEIVANMCSMDATRHPLRIPTGFAGADELHKNPRIMDGWDALGPIINGWYILKNTRTSMQPVAGQQASAGASPKHSAIPKVVSTSMKAKKRRAKAVVVYDNIPALV